jgi:hypothetical protein
VAGVGQGLMVEAARLDEGRGSRHAARV